MNYPFERLIDGLVATMETHVLPDLSDDFARGQAFGVVYMLKCMKRRAGWTEAYLAAQVKALAGLAGALDPILARAEGAPRIEAVREIAPGADEAVLIGARETLNAGICVAFEWLSANDRKIPEAERARMRALMDDYLTLQLKTELAFDVPINFSEISTGKARG